MPQEMGQTLSHTANKIFLKFSSSPSEYLERMLSELNNFWWKCQLSCSSHVLAFLNKDKSWSWALLNSTLSERKCQQLNYSNFSDLFCFLDFIMCIYIRKCSKFLKFWEQLKIFKAYSLIADHNNLVWSASTQLRNFSWLQSWSRVAITGNDRDLVVTPKENRT